MKKLFLILSLLLLASHLIAADPAPSFSGVTMTGTVGNVPHVSGSNVFAPNGSALGFTGTITGSQVSGTVGAAAVSGSSSVSGSSKAVASGSIVNTGSTGVLPAGHFVYFVGDSITLGNPTLTGTQVDWERVLMSLPSFQTNGGVSGTNWKVIGGDGQGLITDAYGTGGTNSAWISNSWFSTWMTPYASSTIGQQTDLVFQTPQNDFINWTGTSGYYTIVSGTLSSATPIFSAAWFSLCDSGTAVMTTGTPTAFVYMCDLEYYRSKTAALGMSFRLITPVHNSQYTGATNYIRGVLDQVIGYEKQWAALNGIPVFDFTGWSNDYTNPVFSSDGTHPSYWENCALAGRVAAAWYNSEVPLAPPFDTYIFTKNFLNMYFYPITFFDCTATADSDDGQNIANRTLYTGVSGTGSKAEFHWISENVIQNSLAGAPQNCGIPWSRWMDFGINYSPQGHLPSSASASVWRYYVGTANQTLWNPLANSIGIEARYPGSNIATIYGFVCSSGSTLTYSSALFSVSNVSFTQLYNIQINPYPGGYSVICGGTNYITGLTPPITIDSANNADYIVVEVISNDSTSIGNQTFIPYAVWMR